MTRSLALHFALLVAFPLIDRINALAGWAMRVLAAVARAAAITSALVMLAAIAAWEGGKQILNPALSAWPAALVAGGFFAVMLGFIWLVCR